jgi:hypothetical protein
VAIVVEVVVAIDMELTIIAVEPDSPDSVENFENAVSAKILRENLWEVLCSQFTL